MSNFWEKLKALRQAPSVELLRQSSGQVRTSQGKPILILAPMADVTDTVFRQIIAGCKKPDVFFTEFVSCDGLCSEGRDKLLKNLKFNKRIERPIVAQFFGSKPENFYKCAKLAQKLGFDGIDINMGCPDKKIEKQGAGAALIKTPELAQQIIAETKRGASSAGRRIPVSVKTRIGFNKPEIETWIPALLKAKPDAIILHGRTRKEMSNAPAHWDLIGKAAEMARDSGVLIIGNGDVMSLSEAKEKAKQYNLDGVMVGRGIFANPWFFNPDINPAEIKPKDKIALLIKHLRLFDKTYGKTKNFDIMKKFFKMYISGWNGAKILRVKLMEAKSAKEALKILK